MAVKEFTTEAQLDRRDEDIRRWNAFGNEDSHTNINY
jgi:hypothetical protein